MKSDYYILLIGLITLKALSSVRIGFKNSHLPIRQIEVLISDARTLAQYSLDCMVRHNLRNPNRLSNKFIYVYYTLMAITTQLEIVKAKRTVRLLNNPEEFWDKQACLLYTCFAQDDSLSYVENSHPEMSYLLCTILMGVATRKNEKPIGVIKGYRKAVRYISKDLDKNLKSMSKEKIDACKALDRMRGLVKQLQVLVDTSGKSNCKKENIFNLSMFDGVKPDLEKVSAMAYNYDYVILLDVLDGKYARDFL